MNISVYKTFTFFFVFLSLSALAQIDRRRGDFAAGTLDGVRVYDSLIRNADGTVTILNPRLKTSYGIMPLKADVVKICQAFGYMGAFPETAKFEVSDKRDMLKLYTTIRANNPLNVNPDKDISVSFNVEKTMGDLPYINFHYATQVTCGSLQDII